MKIKINLVNTIALEKTKLPQWLLDEIKSRLTFDNPQYVEAKKRNFWTGKIDKYIRAYIEDDRYIFLFRGCLNSFTEYLNEQNIKWEVDDLRRKLPKTNFTFHGKLHNYQTQAADKIIEKFFSVLVAPCGSGKTVIALHIITKRQQPTLVIVHTKELLDQWVDRIIQYLKIEKDEIGMIGCGKERIKPITIGMAQTLHRRDLLNISTHFGQIIVDECHHTPATTFTKIAVAFDSYYMLGLSATPYRHDKLDDLIQITLGDISATITEEDLRQTKVRIKPKIIPRKTDFDYDYKKNPNFTSMISYLVINKRRNRLIISDIIKELQEDNTCLILSGRKNHCKILTSMIQEKRIQSVTLIGSRPKKVRENIIKNIDKGAVRVIFATGSLAGEGLDIPRLNRLFIVTPIKWKGKIIQYIGRTLRTHENKKDAKIYDYVDSNVDILYGMYAIRKREVYDKMK